ncbi:MAG TPA: hypothetical protein PLQ36_03760, partial [Candidatus Gracilibacteria bacterium]|nr:hypothetical protein [Candidatus Gracilibacteria bacterium]
MFFKKYQEWLKIMAISLLIVFSTAVLSTWSKPVDNISVIDTVMVHNNQTFRLNGILGVHDFINTYDLIATEKEGVSVILNQLGVVKIFPNSEVIFLNFGDRPVLKVLSGEVDVETANEIVVETYQNQLVLRQGGAKVRQTAYYAQFSNYYGSSRILIDDDKAKLLLSYVLPLRKQIRIYEQSNKNNWHRIRYSKLNKELRLQDFNEILVR